MENAKHIATRPLKYDFYFKKANPDKLLTRFIRNQITEANSAACLIARFASNSAATSAPPIK